MSRSSIFTISDPELSPGHRADNAVVDQAMLALEGAHCRVGDRAEGAIGRDAERALQPSDGGAYIAPAQRPRRGSWIAGEQGDRGLEPGRIGAIEAAAVIAALEIGPGTGDQVGVQRPVGLDE